MDFIIDFWNQHPILSVLSGLFAFIPLVSWFFRLLLQLSLKLISKLSGRAIEQQQLRDKIIDIVSRPLLTLGNTLRFGLSFWIKGKDKKDGYNYHVYIFSSDWRYSIWLKNKSDLELERNEKFRTFQEARESINSALWTFTILYEQTDKNGVHVISIKSIKFTLAFLNLASQKVNGGLFCGKLINWEWRYFSFPTKKYIEEELLNL